MWREHLPLVTSAEHPPILHCLRGELGTGLLLGCFAIGGDASEFQGFVAGEANVHGAVDFVDHLSVSVEVSFVAFDGLGFDDLVVEVVVEATRYGFVPAK